MVWPLDRYKFESFPGDFFNMYPMAEYCERKQFDMEDCIKGKISIKVQERSFGGQFVVCWRLASLSIDGFVHDCILSNFDVKLFVIA